MYICPVTLPNIMVTLPDIMVTLSNIMVTLLDITVTLPNIMPCLGICVFSMVWESENHVKRCACRDSLGILGIGKLDAVIYCRK